MLTQASELYPGRSTLSDGLCASAAHSAQNPTSDHEPDSRGICHAADLTDDPAHGCDVWALWQGLIARADPRVKYLIKNRQIWNPSIAPYWRAYYGSNPHEKHGHCSILTAHENDVGPWFSGSGTGDEIMASEADRIIETIGRYEQDTRKLLIGYMERIAVAARKTEAVRTRLILAAVRDAAAGKKAPTERQLESKVAKALKGEEGPDEAGPNYVAEIEALGGALDDAVAAGGLESREDVDRFVETYRADLAKLAG